MKILFLLLMLFVATDGARQGNDAFDKGDFAGAEAAYREAIAANPDDARLHFNLGNALARQGKLDEAISSYERFKEMSSSASDRALADYNIGNIYGAQEKWDRAANQFRSSLRQNPTDNDAKFNFELAKRNLQQQQQDPNQRNQQQDENSENNENDPDQDQQQQQDDSDSNSNNDPNQQQQDGDQDEQDDAGQPQQRPQPESDITQEEADRILNALENKEKDLLKDFHKNQIPSNARHAKNW
jgi:Ca-activated chloride channel homolog